MIPRTKSSTLFAPPDSALIALAGTLLGASTVPHSVLAQSKLPNVVPGQSMGRISLGMTPTQVHKLLGKPDKTLKLKNGLLDDLYKSKTTRPDSNSGLTVRDRLEVLYRAGKTVQLEATSPVFRTNSGLSTSSTVHQLRTSSFNWRLLVYSYEVGEDGHQNFYFWDRGRGLTFEFQGWQENLMDSNSPTTLIVHPKGARVIADAGGVLETESRSVEPAMAN